MTFRNFAQQRVMLSAYKESCEKAGATAVRKACFGASRAVRGQIPARAHGKGDGWWQPPDDTADRRAVTRWAEFGWL